jgi:hypothetical protein
MAIWPFKLCLSLKDKLCLSLKDKLCLSLKAQSVWIMQLELNVGAQPQAVAPDLVHERSLGVKRGWEREGRRARQSCHHVLFFLLFRSSPYCTFPVHQVAQVHCPASHLYPFALRCACRLDLDVLDDLRRVDNHLPRAFVRYAVHIQCVSY